MQPSYGERFRSSPSLLQGLAARSQIIECPLRAFQVTVTRCSGIGECAAVCMVNVFGKDTIGNGNVQRQQLIVLLKRGKKLHVTDPFFAFYLRWGQLAAGDQ